MWVDKYHYAHFQQMKIYSSVKLEEVKDVAAGSASPGDEALRAMCRRGLTLIR